MVGRQRAEPERSQSAFTLIEILAVVAIFALLAAMIAPNLGSVTSRTLRNRAEELAGRLELARQRSVMTGVPHRVLIDLDEQGYRLEWWVTEAEAEGREPEPPQPLDLRGQTAIPLAAPVEDERFYRPVPGTLGRFVWLEDSVYFAGLDTASGWIESGDASIDFERDGTASFTSLQMNDESGASLVLDVRPLAEAVRIENAPG